MKPVIDRTFSFDQAREAFTYMASGATLGKWQFPCPRAHGDRRPKEGATCSIVSRRRTRVLRAIGEPAISSRLRSLAIRIAVRVADGTCRSACKLSNVNSVQAGSTPASHARTCEFQQKILSHHRFSRSQ